MSDRSPPLQEPPKFKVGDRVTAFGQRGVWTIDQVNEMSEEWLIRTGYAAGYWSYDMTFPAEPHERLERVSGNMLTLAVIETLGGLVE